MILEYALLVLGIFLLIKGADSLVDGSVTLSKKLGVSSVIVGLTVVSMGTSMPELIVNLLSGFTGKTDIALGNIVGSNIANILLILGLTASVYPVVVQRSVIWKEIPFSLLAALALFVAANDHFLDFTNGSVIGRGDGLLFFGFLSVFVYYSLDSARRTRKLDLEKTLEYAHQGSLRITLLIIGGAVLLSFGGKLVVDNVIAIARSLNISEYLISSTVVAVGTSLPELITSLVAAKRGEMGISVGNVVGSNIINILLIMGITATLFTVPVSGPINADLIFLIFASMLLFAFMFIGERHKLLRWQGMFFVALYVLYLMFNIYRG